MLVTKVRLEHVVRVSFDAMEKVIISGVEQVGDDRHDIATVTEPFAAAQQRVESRAVRRRAHARPRWRRILNARDNRRAEDIVQRRGRVPCERSTRIAYSRLVPDDRRVVT